MIKVTSSDKDLFRVLIGIAVSVGLIVLLLHFLGESHGLICMTIALIIQITFLTGRVVALERGLQSSRKSFESEVSNLAEKAE